MLVIILVIFADVTIVTFISSKLESWLEFWSCYFIWCVTNTVQTARELRQEIRLLKLKLIRFSNAKFRKLLFHCKAVSHLNGEDYPSAAWTREASLWFHCSSFGVDRWYHLSFVAVRPTSRARRVMFLFLLNDFLILKQCLFFLTDAFCGIP